MWEAYSYRFLSIISKTQQVVSSLISFDLGSVGSRFESRPLQKPFVIFLIFCRQTPGYNCKLATIYIEAISSIILSLNITWCKWVYFSSSLDFRSTTFRKLPLFLPSRMKVGALTESTLQPWSYKEASNSVCVRLLTQVLKE
jgi:hypothetical protein